MTGFKEVSSDIASAKVSEVKPVDVPKEIGENKNSYSDIPKEIGETSEKVRDIPQEIGENNTLQPKTVYDVDGEKHYTDDNGNVYRINNDLVANNNYELNGYKYETDNKGRIVSAGGKLHLKNHEGYNPIPQKATLSEIGKGDEKATDDRGHPIGDRFDGVSDIGNLVSQDSSLNRGEYNKFEDSLAKEIAKGNEVYMKVEMDYPGKSFRPDSFSVSYSINGEKFFRTFSNNPRGDVK